MIKSIPQSNQGNNHTKSNVRRLDLDFRKEEADFPAPTKEREPLKLPGIGCRHVGCGLFLLFISCIVFGLYLLIARPPQLINPLKNWLNGDLQATQPSTLTLEQVNAQVNSQAQNFQVGNNQLVFNEDQINTLLASRVIQSPVGVELKEGVGTVYFDIQSQTDTPLWLVADLEVDEKGELFISHLGTRRLGLPGFVSKAIQNLILGMLQANGQPVGKLLDTLLKLPENIEIKDIHIKQDKIVVDLYIQTGLENLFN